MAETTVAATEDRQDLSGLFSRIKRQLPVIIAATVLVMGLAFVASLFLPKRYTASAELEFSPQPPVAGAPQLALSDLARDAKIDAEVQNATSLPVAVRVVEAMKLDQDPVLMNEAKDFAKDEATGKQAIAAALLRNVKASRVGTTSLIQIGFTDKSPVRAMNVANAFSQAFIENDLTAKGTQYKEVNAQITARLQSLHDAVEKANADVAAFRLSHNLLAQPDSVTAEQEIANIRTALAQARAEAASSAARSSASGNTVTSGGSNSSISTAALASLRAQQSDTAARVAALQARYGDKYPALIDAQKSLETINAQINEEMRGLSRSASNATQAADSQASSLQRSLGAAESRMVGNVRASVQLGDLQRKAQIAQDAYQQLLTTSQQQNAEQSVARPDMRPVAPATLPLTPSSPNIPVLVFMGAVAGLAIGLAIAYIRERWVQGLDNVDDVESLLGVDYFNSIPTPASSIEGARGTDAAQAVLLHPMSAYTEAFRNLGTSMSYAVQGTEKRGKILGITSALPKEGKTTTSVSVARVFATGGSTTLLMDTDLRRRSISQMLAPDATVGLAELLAGTATLEDVIRVDESGAHVLPLSPTTHRTPKIFESDAFTELLEFLRGRYELIVVDTAPVLAVTDTRVLLHHFDVLALLVRWRSTPFRAARAALHQIESVGGQVTGIALTMVNLKAQSQAGYGDPSAYVGYMKDYYTKG